MTSASRLLRNSMCEGSCVCGSTTTSETHMSPAYAGVGTIRKCGRESVESGRYDGSQKPAYGTNTLTEGSGCGTGHWPTGYRCSEICTFFRFAYQLNPKPCPNGSKYGMIGKAWPVRSAPCG